MSTSVLRYSCSASTRPAVSAAARFRPGEAHDVPEVTAMHARCSDETLHRRFHAPVARVTPRMARRLLAPTAGWSVVAECGPQLVGLACAAPVSATHVEVGVLVEDRYQRVGIGTRLLHEVARVAGTRGYERLECHVSPDNPAALATLRRAAMVARITWSDGVLEISAPLHPARTTPLSHPA